MSTQGQSLNYPPNLPTDLPSLDPPLMSVNGARRPISVLGFQRIMTAMEVVLDFATTIVAAFSAYYIYYELSVGRHLYYPPKELSLLAAIVGLLVVLLFERDSAYKGGTSLLRIRETERALKIPCMAIGLLLPLSWLLGQAYSRGTILILIIVLPIALMIQKGLFFSWVEALHAKGYGIQKVLIYGAGHTGRRLFTTLIKSPKLGYKPVAMVDHDPDLNGTQVFELGYNRRQSVYVDQGPVTEEYLRSISCDTLLIAIPDLPREFVFSLLQAATAVRCQVAFLPDQRHLNAHANDSIDLDGLLLTFAGERSVSWLYLLLKRGFDMIVAALFLLLLSPLLGILALLILADSEGPSLFRQERVGINGRKFEILKFRTMHVDAPKYATSPILSEDRRITRIGRLLRKTSLDELPQLVNVLLGEMSLVGPRPEMPFLVESYGVIQRQRLKVVPGITGLWQLSADRAFLIHESPEYDMYYIRNQGFFLDLAILIHTALFAMRGV